MRLRFQITGPGIGVLEGKLVDPLQIGHRFGRGVDRHAPAARRGETPQIVEPHHVIGVRVREEDGVDLPDIFAQTLGAKIGSGIDDIGALRRFEINRSAGAIDRADRSSGRPRNRSGSSARPAEVPVPRKVRRIEPGSVIRQLRVES